MTLHFLELGRGTPVLALHGLGPDHRLMSGCVEPVFRRTPGYRRIYPDLPGMGQSAAPATMASSDEMLEAVERFVDQAIGDEGFLLLGESYGGYLARGLTARLGERVLGLALICPIGAQIEPATRNLPTRQVLRREQGLATTNEFESIAVVATARTLQRFETEIAPGLELSDSGALDRVRQRYALSVDPEAGPVFTRPTLIVAGRQDDIVGYDDQWALLPHYPRASFATLDVAGHNLQFERPDLFEALITDWLERVAYEMCTSSG